MTSDDFEQVAVWFTLLGGAMLTVAAMWVYARAAWVMGRVCHRLAALLRDSPGTPCGVVPFGACATFWWALRRGLRPARTQRQLAHYAASQGVWEPWMGQPAVR